MIRMMIWSNDISTQNLYESKTKKTIHKKKKEKKDLLVFTLDLSTLTLKEEKYLSTFSLKT